MINRITMETIACLRSKCHLKQNLILSWPELDRDHSGIPVAFPISGAKQNTQPKNFSDTRTGILGSIASPCDFLPAWSDGPTNFKKSDLIPSWGQKMFYRLFSFDRFYLTTDKKKMAVFPLTLLTLIFSTYPIKVLLPFLDK
jgi:hypothetical protein